MRVPVVNIREMRMLVDDSDMLVPMIMRIITVPLERVRMRVVCVMLMPMTMHKRLMLMFVLVALCQMQPHAPAH